MKYYCGLLLFLCSLSCFAGQHAILVGVGNYPLIKQLEGPLNDVQLVKSVLLKRWGFKETDIVTLVDQQASKQHILDAIARVNTIGNAGDEVFIYLSGHGTSAADNDMGAGVGVPTKTGAFIPYDISGVKNESDLLDRLIIGKRDLKPLLAALDESGFNVFFAVDTCYSGNTVRSQRQHNGLDKRFIRFNDLLPNTKKATKLEKRLKFAATPQHYPYKNVFALSAAQEYQVAEDIPERMLAQYPTLDGKPHGAFTDTLVRLMSREVATTYGELALSVQQMMQQRGFTSEPNILPNKKYDNHKTLDKYIFNKNP